MVVVFPRKSNGSSLRATRVLPEGHASASNALKTFADPPSHRLDGPPSPAQYGSVTSPVAHADILTKALAFDLFAFHRKFLTNLK